MNTPSSYLPNSHKAIRDEFQRMMHSGEIQNSVGTSCVNCGCTESIEYHHIVPVLLGGTNNIRNIVPLCHKCHMAANRGRHINDYRQYTKKMGRHLIVSDADAFKAYDMLLSGEIGSYTCKKLLKCSENTKIKDSKQYKRWCEEHGILKMENRLDWHITKSGSIQTGHVIGFVIYADGRRDDIIFHDTGTNDYAVYAICDDDGTTTNMTWRDIKCMAHEFTA